MMIAANAVWGTRKRQKTPRIKCDVAVIRDRTSAGKFLDNAASWRHLWERLEDETNGDDHQQHQERGQQAGNLNQAYKKKYIVK